MKKEILVILKSNPGKYVSGEEISNQLGVSRTAIWKHIQGLREEGYQLDSQSRRGYCLREVPDKLFPEEVQEGLNTRVMGKCIVYYKSLGSTNDMAKKLARQGAAEGMVVVAEEQSGGKGRRGRFWVSPEGQGVWMSVVLRPKLSPAKAPIITIMAAVAVARAISRVCGQKIGIKWPNDIVFQGKKLAGILTEMSAENDFINHVVLGIGTNVNIPPEGFPVELQEKGTSLSIIASHRVSRKLYLQALLEELEKVYAQLCLEDFAGIMEGWREYSVTLGEDVRIEGINEVLFGRAVDVDSQGVLLLRQKNGEIVRILAGDVTLRKDDGCYS
ncbi:MAG: biotin--[acetyl-CoA-carboxylase] ligase [Carboxydocellales bacterium]